jgi:predicted site-specific integrase-resolvase
MRSQRYIFAFAAGAGRPKLMKIGHFSSLNKVNGLERPKDMTESDSNSRRFGYARVSTYGQTLDAQLEHLREAGCAKIFRGKASGARAQRRELLRLSNALRPATK